MASVVTRMETARRAAPLPMNKNEGKRGAKAQRTTKEEDSERHNGTAEERAGSFGLSKKQWVKLYLRVEQLVGEMANPGTSRY